MKEPVAFINVWNDSELAIFVMNYIDDICRKVEQKIEQDIISDLTTN